MVGKVGSWVPARPNLRVDRAREPRPYEELNLRLYRKDRSYVALPGLQ